MRSLILQRFTVRLMFPKELDISFEVSIFEQACWMGFNPGSKEQNLSSSASFMIEYYYRRCK